MSVDGLRGKSTWGGGGETREENWHGTHMGLFEASSTKGKAKTPTTKLGGKEKADGTGRE